MSAEKRDPYADVATAARDAFDKAAKAGLKRLEHLTLEAVVSRTALWSRFEDDVYLGVLASMVYGVERSKRWQRDNIGRALKTLDEKNIVTRQRIGTRDEKGPYYRLGLVRPESSADSPRTRMRHESGASPAPNQAHDAPQITRPNENSSSRSDRENVDPLERFILKPTAQHLVEFAAARAAVGHEFGEARTQAGLATLGDRQFPWSSDFRRALTTATAATPIRSVALYDPDCSSCDHGWREMPDGVVRCDCTERLAS
jgi:hypothetical protein